MTDTHSYIQRLVEANPLRESLLRSVIQSLQLPPGSRGLDIGCGLGFQELLLAEAIGTGGHVTGLDILPEFLAYAEALAAQAALSEQVMFRQGDMNCLPFEADSFDWAWSVDCAGYPAGEWMPLLHEMMRVVRPGGSIILLAWSSQQLLPGYPVLEARLNATCSAYLPFLSGKRPDENFLRAARWLQEVGMEDIRAQTFVRTVQSPLDPAERTALLSLFDMLWGQPQPEVSPEDWKEYQRLCTSGSSDLVLDLPGYYGFFTYSMFRGKLP
jgi:demethylmenaquinone methyltransferase/2-methoxy-6-polyprenyl-1,4-benzoquinol methylase